MCRTHSPAVSSVVSADARRLRVHAGGFDQRINEWPQLYFGCCAVRYINRIVRRRNLAAASRLGTEAVAHTGSAADCR